MIQPQCMLVRLAELTDAASLPRIEKSASELFASMPGLGWLATSAVTSVAEHHRLIQKRTLWVAHPLSSALVGFLAAEQFGDALHIWELSVHIDWQRRGISRTLVQNATEHARVSGLQAVTLTTFTDVPWNGPAYAKIGFQQVPSPDERLRGILQAEAARGLPAHRRTAMRLPLR